MHSGYHERTKCWLLFEIMLGQIIMEFYTIICLEYEADNDKHRKMFRHLNKWGEKMYLFKFMWVMRNLGQCN